MSKDFYKVIENRRTIYGISKESTISDERLKEIIEFAVKNTPSAFNSQSSRVVVLIGEEHNKVWNITKEELRKIVPVEKFQGTEKKIDSFKNGYGTILFWKMKMLLNHFKNNMHYTKIIFLYGQNKLLECFR